MWNGISVSSFTLLSIQWPQLFLGVGGFPAEKTRANPIELPRIGRSLFQHHLSVELNVIQWIS